MTVDTSLAPPDVEELVVAWLTPLGTTAVLRPAGAPLPFRLVRRLTGGDDKITDYPVVSVHTFAATYDEASRAANVAHIRMLALRPWQRVAISTGTVWADHVSTEEGPHPEYYDQQIHRFVARYQIDTRFRADLGS